MSKEKRSFTITCEGQYYGAHETTGTPTVKRYVAKFVLPSQESALSVICKHLLDPYLRKHYDDYAKFRSHKITSVVTNGHLPDPKVLQMSFDDMSIQDLDDFCLIKHIFIDPYKHKDLEKCREEIRKTWEARVAQAKADHKSGDSAKQAEVDDLLKMNELPKSGDNPEINLNQQRIGVALKAGGAKAAAPIEDTTPAEIADTPLPPVEEDDLLG